MSKAREHKISTPIDFPAFKKQNAVPDFWVGLLVLFSDSSQFCYGRNMTRQ
jgi:hypothetical protein